MAYRWQQCSYEDPGQYFVTICTKRRACLFGEVGDGEMHLSPDGKIARDDWLDLPNHFTHVALDAFVFMPNHLHGILVFHHRGPALGIVVGSFKAGVSRRLGRPVWQRYYYDRVVRGKKELDEIRAYIERNPFQT